MEFYALTNFTRGATMNACEPTAVKVNGKRFFINC